MSARPGPKFALAASAFTEMGATHDARLVERFTTTGHPAPKAG
jgi:hypothetical protein